MLHYMCTFLSARLIHQVSNCVFAFLVAQKTLALSLQVEKRKQSHRCGGHLKSSDITVTQYTRVLSVNKGVMDETSFCGHL